MADLLHSMTPGPTHRYLAFGGSFESALSFPVLAQAPTGVPPDWSLDRVDHLEEGDGWVLEGSSPVEEGVVARLSRRRADGALRLTYDDTGVFEISPDGRRVTWCAPPEADEERARKDVLGRVVALALHQRGVWTLHGSAVALGARGVCFLAPKYHGKSTTAAALVDAGGTLLADDLVVIERRLDEVLLRPTLPTVNLWPDAARQVGRRGRVVDESGSSAKVQLSYEAGGELEGGIVLDAAYLLAPVNSTGGEVGRTVLSVATAAMALLGQLKVGDLLGSRAVFELLPSAIELARTVEVHRLEVPRDLERLQEVVAAIDRWHGDGGGRR